MQVDIYLYISSKAPTVSGGKYKYKLTCNGGSIEGGGETGPTTGHRLAMTCAIEALKRMSKASMITIHTSCRYLISGHAYLSSWQKSDWTKSGGEPLRNADLWQRLYELQKPHAIKYVYDAKVDNFS